MVPIMKKTATVVEYKVVLMVLLLTLSVYEKVKCDSTAYVSFNFLNRLPLCFTYPFQRRLLIYFYCLAALITLYKHLLSRCKQ